MDFFGPFFSFLIQSPELFTLGQQHSFIHSSTKETYGKKKSILKDKNVEKEI